MRRAGLLFTLLLLLCSSVSAQGVRFGVGAFGGMDFPIGQDDQAKGTVFGLKGKVNFIPIITFEPKVAFTSFGEPEGDEVVLGFDGSKVTFYGIDAVIGAPFGGKGFGMFAVVGAGFYNYKRDQTSQDDTNLGWSAGLGFSIGFVPMISADFRGTGHVVPYDEGGTKKSVSVTAGLNYFFGM
ncbi:MAG: outer membrane beta-barrel protein [Candidatus Zixiibacteriota bacterium]|nr:MAG: outer membrane beta-barrel protein [candidate division Zixibacteria bacterium]